MGQLFFFTPLGTPKVSVRRQRGTTKEDKNKRLRKKKKFQRVGDSVFASFRCGEVGFAPHRGLKPHS